VIGPAAGIELPMGARFGEVCVRFIQGLRRLAGADGVAPVGLFDAPVRSLVSEQRLATAERRARDLLLRMLAPTQRREFDVHGYFSVNVPGRGRFWIFPWRSLNVVDPRTGDCYCAVLEGRLPVYDLMLAQKLLLENEPQYFFSVANRHPSFVLRPGGPGPAISGV
jgi:hypothetical protein